MKPRVNDNLSSFEVWPKKTFLGLDKSKAHCFTLPKTMTSAVIEKFNLMPGYLQHAIIFVIDGIDYKATAKMVIIDRSKPNKLEKKNSERELWYSFSGAPSMKRVMKCDTNYLMLLRM